jgi:ABC-type uncharacterized transport system permease subunit
LAELLFWPAFLAYSEAAVAYFGEARHPGRAGRYAIWGVRIGWVFQTLLLAYQVARDESFPWTTWAGSLNLFVWLVVTVYLVWGSRRPFGLLGLAVIPLAAGLLIAAWAGGGVGSERKSRYSDLFLVFHVGFLMVAFAGFTLAAAVAAMYLWQERRLKRHPAQLLQLPTPGLTSLDRVGALTIMIAFPALTLGIAAGDWKLRSQSAEIDSVMVATFATWVVYAVYLALRRMLGWTGRRAAYVALLGFVLVIVVRLVLPATHFS